VENYAVYYKGALRSYTNSGDMGVEGWDLIGDVNQFVECSEYENKYKSTYPQRKIVLVLKKQTVESITSLPEDGALPVGTLFGREIDALNGEKRRIFCTDFVAQKYMANRGYDYADDARSKYKMLLDSGLKQLGKYKVARGAIKMLTNFDELLMKNIHVEQILCIITGQVSGSQTAFLKDQESSYVNIGVVVDTE